MLSLLGSTVSLYRITEVNRLLDGINRVSIPLGRLFTQMQSDADVLRRELERGLGYTHWKDPHWKPRPVPHWIEEVLQSETDRFVELIRGDSDWATPDARVRWREWADGISLRRKDLEEDAARLYAALERGDEATSLQIYPRWSSNMEEWRRQLEWGASEYERALRQAFTQAENRVTELQTALEMILGVVVLMSLLLLWLGERALRPLAELTRLARTIAARGLRREDKAALPEIPLSRNDEVSQLAREFHRMATVLLEREKTVELQKQRLQEQNTLLRDMGELNENVLNSIKSILVVVDLTGRITQCNPVASRWLNLPEAKAIGSDLLTLKPFQALGITLASRRVDPASYNGRIYGGRLMPLQLGQGNGAAHGIILVLDDLTEEMDLQNRLRQAENLAAVGRLSAQVAHEVRNPLHSIGLEAEMAAEMAAQLKSAPLRQSLQSILSSVDRLQKITENYLKLSRLSSGKKTLVDVGELLESVLAIYAPVCEDQKITVDWKHESGSPLLVQGDRDLLEHVLSNLMRNALQALEGFDARPVPRIAWRLGTAESGRVWLRIEDNGPGIPDELRDKLFTPFVTTRAQGTGLGLSFVKKVMEDHGGQVVCPVRVMGSGACFELTLPAEKQERAWNESSLSTTTHSL